MVENTFLIFIIVISVLIPFAAFIYDWKKYKKTTYYQVTKNSYSSVRRNRGIAGEYRIYSALRHFEKDGGRFLFNVYLPKDNNETTEIDVLLISAKGLFVFESKNFSGWIFGNEAHKNWTQTLPRGRGSSHKSGFYNPIMQNAAHIRHLKRAVDQNVPFKSIIVFSDECTLKNVTVKNPDVIMTNLRYLDFVFRQAYERSGPNCLTQVDMDNIYKKLYPYTQVSKERKIRHIKDIGAYM